MGVSKALRFQIFRRDGHACQYCGGMPPDVALVIDHVVPVALGGSDDPGNLITSCRDCNIGKAATPPDAPVVEAVSERQLAYRAEMDRLAQEAHDERKGNDVRWFTEKWDSFVVGCQCGGSDCHGDGVPLPDNWAGSVRTWIARGLARSDVEWAIDRTMGKSDLRVGDAFRYMAGICWRVLTEREEAAAAAMQAMQEGEE